jgi:hypothetical protein
MRYAKQILIDELRVLKKAIAKSDWTQYQEALKVREKKCKDLESAIELIDKQNTKNTF